MLVAAFREYSKLEIEYEYSKHLVFPKAMQPASSDSSTFALGRWRWGAGKQEELLEQMLCRWYTSCEAPKTDCFWEGCWGTSGSGGGVK